MRLGFVRPLYAKTGDRTIYPIPKKQTYMYLEWLVDMAKKHHGIDGQYGTSDKGHWVQLGIASRRYSLSNASAIRRDILQLVKKSLEYRPAAKRIAQASAIRKRWGKRLKDFENSLTPEQMALYKELDFHPAFERGW